MLDKHLAMEALDAALSTGGDFAEIFAEDRRDQAVALQDSHVERVNSGRLHGAGVRVYDGLTAVYAYTNDFGREGLLKETYLKMLSLLRTGHEKEAEKAMREAVDTEAGREFASLLGTWEYLKPEQLSKSIESYRSSIREACITRQKKKDALISDFIYFPATANVFLVFMNFIYISYFMEQKEMFQMIF